MAAAGATRGARSRCKVAPVSISRDLVRIPAGGPA